jgi:DNA repair exonuclease SbcCD ATPase subunit
MATTNPSTNPGTPKPKPSSSSDNSKQRIIAISATLIVVLLGLSIFLFVKNQNLSKAQQMTATQLDESEQLKAELEEQYYQALSDLEEMRGSNEELNALIDSQKEELAQSKARIDGLLRNKRDLGRAREEITKLTAQVEGYVAEINQLRAENQELTEQNVQLADEKQTLETQLTTTIQESEATKANLMTQNEELSQERAQLAKKVNIASVVKVENIEVTGLKIRNNGKKAKKTRANNVDELQVCFTLTENNVVEPNMERFFIRIVNPLGETLAIEDMGSGVITSNDSGEQIRFTKTEEIDYDRSSANMCSIWSPSLEFQSGPYTVEVYNKGYLAGSTTFELK